jgi:hypothetical protein
MKSLVGFVSLTVFGAYCSVYWHFSAWYVERFLNF